jgi:glucose-6-phosphate 1-dehydrogenase
MTMDFSYSALKRGKSLEAYGRVLLDCMRGIYALFWRQDGIEASWAFLPPCP